MNLTTTSDDWYVIPESQVVHKLFRPSSKGFVPDVWDCRVCGQDNSDREDYCGCCGENGYRL